MRVGEGVGIFNVATPAAERGRGLGAAVTSCALERAFGDGCTYAFLQTSTLGEPVYRRLGFRDAGDFTLAFAPPH
jgi:predicted GNAT family acetyltransferase